MPSRRLWLASVFSVAGMSTFSGVFSPSAEVASTYDGNANIIGIVLMLGAASCYSVHILRLSALASRVGNSAGSVLRLAVAKSTTEVILAAGTVAIYRIRYGHAILNLCFANCLYVFFFPLIFQARRGIVLLDGCLSRNHLSKRWVAWRTGYAGTELSCTCCYVEWGGGDCISNVGAGIMKQARSSQI